MLSTGSLAVVACIITGLLVIVAMSLVKGLDKPSSGPLPPVFEARLTKLEDDLAFAHTRISATSFVAKEAIERTQGNTKESKDATE